MTKQSMQKRKKTEHETPMSEITTHSEFLKAVSRKADEETEADLYEWSL
jgi:hypothetical protein